MLTSKISLIILYVTFPMGQKFTCNTLTVPWKVPKNDVMIQNLVIG